MSDTDEKDWKETETMTKQQKPKPLINYEKLDVLIKAYDEYVKEGFDLDLDEERLLLDILTDRRRTRYNDMRTSVALADNPMVNMANNLLRKVGEKKDELD